MTRFALAVDNAPDNPNPHALAIVTGFNYASFDDAQEAIREEHDELRMEGYIEADLPSYTVVEMP